MKTTSIIATVFAISIILLFNACASETLIIKGISVDNVTYTLNNDENEASATGYIVRNGELDKHLYLPDVITSISTDYAVTSISDGAFIEGPWESVELGKNVRSIGSKAFYGCHDIKSVTLYGSTAPIISDSTFDEETYQTASLIISADCHIEGTPWSNFQTIITNK